MSENDNLEIWDNLKQVPPGQLKKIKGGRLSGMTDIKPQWRLKIMTEQFGVCGIGWKYVVSKKWIEEGSENQMVAFVDVDLFIKNDDKWSEAIPGTGGSMFIAKEKSGPYTSDEAYKMATTDALSVAMKSIGVAADIYMGFWDGSKYNYPDLPKQPEKVIISPDYKTIWKNAKMAYKRDGNFNEIEKKGTISEDHKELIKQECE